MKTELLLFMQKPTANGLTFCESKTRLIMVMEPPPLPVGNNIAKYFTSLMLVGLAVLAQMSSAHVTNPKFITTMPILHHCSNSYCTSLDQQSILGYSMFDENNFAPIVDGFGHTRKFYVHIPDDYDTVDGITEKIPLIFAFHGAGQPHKAMIEGKWGDYFDQNIAFVIPKGEPDPCANDSLDQWMQPGFGDNPKPTDLPLNCDPATQVIDSFGDTIAYWDASIPGTFTDVLFVEQLRAMILSRFPRRSTGSVT